MKVRALTLHVLLGAAALSGSCARAASGQAAPIVQPGAPGEATKVVSREEALARPAFTAADVRFMQGMIGHHAQAIEMTALLKDRTRSEEMKKLAQRIEVSQADEIRMMREWLEAHGAEVPGEHAHHAAAGRMPGMLTPEQMQQLAAASGPEFDRLFLDYMIRHHEGALVMVRDLFAIPGAGQESDIFAFASDVDADQRMEINRMAGMLKELQK